jgi:hypothetical protein
MAEASLFGSLSLEFYLLAAHKLYVFEGWKFLRAIVPKMIFCTVIAVL